MTPIAWQAAEECVSGRTGHPCVAAALYEWSWVAIVGGVCLLGLYLHYKSRKLSRLAAQLGVSMADAAVMLRPDRKGMQARSIRTSVVSATASLAGAAATGLVVGSVSAAFVGLLIVGSLSVFGGNIYIDWWLITLRVRDLRPLATPPEATPLDNDSPAQLDR